MGFDSVFELENLNGANGFVIPNIYSGSVSIVGDVNGDAISDVAISAPSLGKVFCIFGSKDGFDRAFDLRTLDGENGFVLNNDLMTLTFGESVSDVGDVNNDGINDMLIGDPSGNRAYLIYGKFGRFFSSINVNFIEPSDGFLIIGASSQDLCCNPVSSAGDINNDGISDFMISSVGSGDFAGAVHVIYGIDGNFPVLFNLSNLAKSQGFNILGLSKNDQSGISIDNLKDVNDDGISDIIIGAPGANDNVGQSYVLFGSETFSSPFNLATLNGINGFTINGLSRNNFNGICVSAAGDINADGLSDIITVSLDVNSTIDQSYIIFGSRYGFPSLFSLSSLSGGNGFTINGDLHRVSDLGDVNGDGIDDIIIGAPNLERDAGLSFVLYGKKPLFEYSINLYELSSSEGFVIQGAGHSQIGLLVGGNGDVNGDGINDIIVAADLSDYIIFGEKQLKSPESSKTGIILGSIFGTISALVIAGTVWYKFCFKKSTWKGSAITSSSGTYGTL